MRKHVWATKAKPEDADELKELMENTPQNLCDPAIFGYPTLQVLKATDGEKNLVYMPFQTAFVLESLAISPYSGEKDTAMSLKQLMQIVRYQAEQQGVKEIFMQCSEPRTVSFAQHNGFEELTVKVFRMKL